MQSSELRGITCFVWKVYERGTFFCQKWYIKEYGVGPWDGASGDKTLLSTPRGGGNAKNFVHKRSLVVKLALLT